MVRHPGETQQSQIEEIGLAEALALRRGNETTMVEFLPRSLGDVPIYGFPNMWLFLIFPICGARLAQADGRGCLQDARSKGIRF